MRLRALALGLAAIGIAAALNGCSREAPPRHATSRPALASTAVPTTDAEELRAFAKLYGYVRYFHPSDEAAALDWNTFAIEGARRVVEAEHREQLRTILLELFRPIAPTLEVHDADVEPASPTEPPADRTIVLAWQHLGVPAGDGDNDGGGRWFVGARTGRGRGAASESPADWAPVVGGMEAYAVRGRRIRLSAWLKTDARSDADTATLQLNVVRAEGRAGFADDMNDRPIRSHVWTRYEIEGDVADDAEWITFTGVASGQAPVWFDDFMLEVRGAKKEWTPVPLANPGFEDATPITWALRSTSFDYELVDEAHSGRQSLRMQPRRGASRTLLFPQRPASDEVIARDLGVGLRCRLPLSLRTAAITAPASMSADRPPFSATDPAVRAAAVIIAWNAVRHFFAYFDSVDLDWDAALAAALQDTADDADAEELRDTLARMLARLKDAHATVHAPDEVHGRIPVRLERVEGRVVVVTTTPSSGLKRGDEVVAIDGRSIEKLLVERSATIPGSPQLVQHRLLARMEVARGSPDTSAVLELVRDGKSMPIEVRRESIAALDEFHHPEIERIGPGVFYVDLVHAQWRTIEAVIPKLARARGVVFDLRGYPRDPQFRLLQHLLREPMTTPWLFVPQVIHPDQQPAPTWTAVDEILLPARPRIDARVAFLVDASTGSHPEAIVALVEGLRLGEIVGTPTAGVNGNAVEIGLPGGLSFGFSGLQARRLDGTLYQSSGIQPTHLVARTLAGVRAGRDEVRDAALRLLERTSRR